MALSRLIYGFFQKINSAIFNAKKCEIVVVVFHEICSLEEADDKNHFTSLESFKKFIEEYRESIVPISENFQNLKSKSNLPKYILTFDDIYESAYLNGISLLKERDIPFTIFICPDLIGKPGFIKKEQLNELCAMDNCEVAFHLNHHVFTRKMKKDAFIKEIDCSLFEKEFNVKCSYFAFPYGSMYASKSFFSKKILLSKFKKVFSTSFAHMSISTFTKKRHFLPRMTYSEKTKHLFKKA